MKFKYLCHYKKYWFFLQRLFLVKWIFFCGKYIFFTKNSCGLLMGTKVLEKLLFFTIKVTCGKKSPILTAFCEGKTFFYWVKIISLSNFDRRVLAWPNMKSKLNQLWEDVVIESIIWGKQCILVMIILDIELNKGI